MVSNIGKALAMTRQQSGMSQHQLAVRCKMGRSQTSKYEAGREIMKLDTLEKLLSALNIEPEHFFRLVRSLDDSFVAQRRGRIRGEESVLEQAFESLHLAIDKLQQAVERFLRPGTAPGGGGEAEVVAQTDRGQGRLLAAAGESRDQGAGYPPRGRGRGRERAQGGTGGRVHLRPRPQ